MRGEEGLLPGTRYPDLLRFALIPVFVCLCYAFDWAYLREFTCDCFVAAAELLSIPVIRTSATYFSCGGQQFYFAISCTAVDAFFGSVPLLWHRADWKRISIFWVVYFFSLSAVNLLRLIAGFLLYVRGVPWWLAHEVFGGLFYFGLLMWILRTIAELESQRLQSAVADS